LKNNEADRQELIPCIKGVEAITTEDVNNFVASLPRRIEAYVQARGWYTEK
jgi:hypothetical protein